MVAITQEVGLIRSLDKAEDEFNGLNFSQNAAERGDEVEPTANDLALTLTKASIRTAGSEQDIRAQREDGAPQHHSKGWSAASTGV